MNIYEECLSHPRFDDEIVLITANLIDAQQMLVELIGSKRKVALNINFRKTKFLTNLVATDGMSDRQRGVKISTGDNPLCQMSSVYS